MKSDKIQKNFKHIYATNHTILENKVKNIPNILHQHYEVKENANKIHLLIALNTGFLGVL